jgi:DNA invertase Pin-like site-specific DNA recombinase
MDTTNAQGELLFSVFGALAQYERALVQERVKAGLAAAKRCGRSGGRPPVVNSEQVEQIVMALDGGASKASVCRTFKIARQTLADTLRRVGWTGPTAGTVQPNEVSPPRARPCRPARASVRRSPRAG